MKKWIISIQNKKYCASQRITKCQKKKFIFSIKLIVDEVVPITSKTIYYEDHFDTKQQTKFAKSHRNFKQ